MNHLTRLIFVVLLFVQVSGINAQSITVNTTGALADTSAMLDITTTAKGVLIPRMTAAQRAAIFLPATGLLVYQSDAPAGFYYNSGTALAPVWALMLSGTGGTIAGTLSTAAQPNITSVGTLANLTVTGTVTAGGIRTGSLTASGNVNVQGNLAVGGSLALTALSLSGGLTTTGDAAILGNLALSGVVRGLRLNVRHALYTAPLYNWNTPIAQVYDTDDVVILDFTCSVELPTPSVANKGKVIYITSSSAEVRFGTSSQSGIYYPLFEHPVTYWNNRDVYSRVSSTVVSDGVQWIEISGHGTTTW